MSKDIEKNIQVDASLQGQRIDKALSSLWVEHSRGRIQQWIDKGQILVGAAQVASSYKLKLNDKVVLSANIEPIGEWLPEDMPLNVVYQDDQIIIINKPAALVVHPAAGNWTGTLVNGLLYHFPELDILPRAGIVHRLDKDTTGLMVVARTLEAHTWLVNQLQERLIQRKYQAIAAGLLSMERFTVDQPIGRHPKNRLKMAVVKQGGKSAKTHCKLAESFGDFHLFDVKLDTGRTHQIRVHMAHTGFGLVGDQLYGYSAAWLISCASKHYNKEQVHLISKFPRQALHARSLRLEHPKTHKLMAFEAKPPQDFNNLLDTLRSQE